MYYHLECVWFAHIGIRDLDQTLIYHSVIWFYYVLNSPETRKKQQHKIWIVRCANSH